MQTQRPLRSTDKKRRHTSDRERERVEVGGTGPRYLNTPRLVCGDSEWIFWEEIHQLRFYHPPQHLHMSVQLMVALLYTSSVWRNNNSSLSSTPRRIGTLIIVLNIFVHNYYIAITQSSGCLSGQTETGQATIHPSTWAVVPHFNLQLMELVFILLIISSRP